MTDEFLWKLPKVIKLENAEGTMVKRKSKVVLQYHRPNKTVHLEKYPHHIYPFRDMKQLMSENGSYSIKLANSEIIKVVQTKQQLFEPDLN